MKSVKSYAALKPNTPLIPFNIERRNVGPHDVQIQILYAGICHSDIHQARDEWGKGTFPMVPGHEIAGKVLTVGSDVKKFKAGDHVGVGCMVDSCLSCTPCKEHEEQYCQKHTSYTYNGTEQDQNTPTYGGYSQEIVVKEDFVLHIPQNLPLDKAAPLLCAGITTYSPLQRWNVKPGQHVAVMGLGGLGHMAVKIAVAMGAHVTVISRSDSKQADAQKFGAEGYINTSHPEAFSANQNKFDLMMNTVGSALDLTPYLCMLKIKGTLVQIGVPEETSQLNLAPLVVGCRLLAGSLIGGIKETQEMLDFCGKHNITSDIELIKPEQINEAYDRTVKGDVRYRFVIDILAF